MIQAQGSGTPGKGGMKSLPILWRNWIGSHPTLKKTYKTLERKWRNKFPPQVLPGYVILLSYPRSGNHWVRYIIESITGYTTIGARDGLGPRDTSLWVDTPLRTKIHIPQTRREIIAIKRHKLRKFDSPDAPLILLVRRPSTAIISHNFRSVFDDEFLSQVTDTFIQMFQDADHHKGEVSLVYFEDFVDTDAAKVQSAIEDLMCKMNVVGTELPVTRFMERLEIHSRRAFLTLERAPKSKSISWDSDEVRAAAAYIDQRIAEESKSSFTAKLIIQKYSLKTQN